MAILVCDNQNERPWDDGRHAPAGLPQPAALLDKYGNTVLKVIPSRCKCVVCRICNQRIRSERKKWLQVITADWDGRYFLTLTVDQAGTNTGKGYSSGQKAFEHVTTKRYLSKLMGKLECLWVYVLEFQENGWPHWHFIIDRRVSIKEIRRWWCHKWKVGWQVRIEKERSPGALPGYLTSYLGKAPNIPEWVSRMNRIRFISCSRSLQGFAEWQRGGIKQVKNENPSTKDEHKPTTIQERLNQCGTSCTVLDLSNHQRQFLGNIAMPLRQLAMWSKRTDGYVATIPTHQVVAWSIDFTSDKPRWFPASKILSGWKGIYLSRRWWNQRFGHSHRNMKGADQ